MVRQLKQDSSNGSSASEVGNGPFGIFDGTAVCLEVTKRAAKEYAV